MMVIFKKLLLILSLAMVAMQSNAMWLRKPVLSALAKRSTVLRAPAIARPQIACTKAIMPYAKPQQAVMIRRTNASLSTAQKVTNNSHNSRSSFSASSIKRLVGAGVVLGAVCATAQDASCEGDKAKDETSTTIYQGPFEESRKKFYASLEAKPWGEVSKKYIKALQEEEQKLMEEFFEIAKITPQELDEITEKWVAFWISGENEKNIICKDQFGDIPRPLFNLFQEVANASCLNQADVDMKVSISDGDNMSAARKTIYIHPIVSQSFDEAVKNVPSGSPIKVQVEDGWFSYKTFISNKWNEKAFKALLSHEMQHILHDDSRYATMFHLKAKLQNSHDFYSRHRCFVEKRADILAGLIDPIRLLDLKDFLGNRFHAKDDYHPSLSDRVAYLTQLHQEMIAPATEFPLYV